MTDQHALKGKNLFWIASIIIVLLLAFHVIVSTQITQYNANDIGLLTKLPITFWLGLSFLGILLYFGRESRLRIAVVTVLISFYLFGIPTLISENKALFFGGVSEFYSSMGMQLLSKGYIQFGTLYYLNWLNWPGFFILSGFLSKSASLPVTLFADYFTPLVMALLAIISYKILRLQLNALSSSFGALWFVASFWTGQQFFSSQGISYVIYFVIFLLLAKLFFVKKRNTVLPLAALVLFLGLITTHLLTSFALTLGVVAVFAIYKILLRKHKIAPFYSIVTCILLLSIFIGYQAFVSQSFHGVIEVLYYEFSRGEAHTISVVSQSGIASSQALQMTQLGIYGITIINVIIALIAITMTVTGILIYKKEKVKNDLFWIAWIIAAGMIGVFFFYGGEAINRAFVLMLLPTCYFAAYFFSKKPKILIFVLIIIVFLSIPALYSNQNYMYISSTEMKGGAFFNRYVPFGVTFFCVPLSYLGPRTINGTQLNIQQIAGYGSVPSSRIVEFVIAQSDFIISSNEQKNSFQYFYGVDLLQNLSLDYYNNRLYDNEGYQTYGRFGG